MAVDEEEAWLMGVAAKTRAAIGDSALVLALLPKEDGADYKIAMEIGYSLLLDKPLVLVVAPGSKPPDRLVRVADRIVEWEPSNVGQRKLADTLVSLMDEMREEGLIP